MQPFFTVFGYNISSYTALMILAFLICGGIFYALLKKQVLGIDVFLFALYIFIGGIIGAKLLAMIISLNHFIALGDFNFITWLLSSGMVFYGGVIGGFLMGTLYIKLYGLSPSIMWNGVAVVLPLGSAIGRIGCFLNGCCYGKQTNFIFGVTFKNSLLHEIHGLKVHPTQLYESIACLIIFLVLLYLYKKANKSYFIVFYYTMLYGVTRFIIEFFRGDEMRGLFILSTSQYISLFIIMFGVLLYYSNFKNTYLFKETPPIIKN